MATIKYRDFTIKKRSEGQYDLLKGKTFLTTFVTQRALKKLVDKYYSKKINAFEKEYIFKKIK